MYFILRKSTKIVSILEVTSRSLWISTCAPFTTKIEDAAQFGSLRPPGPHENYDSSEATDFPLRTSRPQQHLYTAYVTSLKLDLTCKNSEDGNTAGSDGAVFKTQIWFNTMRDFRVDTEFLFSDPANLNKKTLQQFKLR